LTGPAPTKILRNFDLSSEEKGGNELLAGVIGNEDRGAEGIAGLIPSRCAGGPALSVFVLKL
jgi:hypothetical protein